MSIINQQHNINVLYMNSSSGSNSYIKLNIDQVYESDIKITIPSQCGEDGHYLQANGKCGDYYHPINCQIIDDQFNVKAGLTPISNQILTTDNKLYKHNVVKSYSINRQMVTFIRGIVEINNSFAILYCNAFGQLMLIKNKVEYLIANDSSTTWSTILVGSAGNIMIGNVFKGNLYHHYYFKGKFYEVPIDMTNNNEKFIAHLTKDGYPCYIYTRYSGMDEVTISYSSDINGESNWNTNIIHTRPSFTSEYLRSYSLFNTYDGVLYLAESCREKYFSVSSCTDITKDDWSKDIIYETGFVNYQVFNKDRNFIIDNRIYSIDTGWSDLNLKVGILDICHQIILADDGCLYYIEDDLKINKLINLVNNIITGSITILPSGEIMALIVNDVVSIKLYRLSIKDTKLVAHSDVILL